MAKPSVLARAGALVSTSGAQSCGPALLLVALIATAARDAYAQESTSMATERVLFDRARQLMEARDFATACPKLEQALSIDPNASGVKANLAFCYEHVGKVASAWGLFLDVANLEHLAGRADREQAARTSATALEGRVPHITLEIGEAADAVAVSRDGKEIQRALWNSRLPVDPGDHTIRASASSRAPWSLVVHVSEGDDRVIHVPALVPTAVSSSPPVLEAPTPPVSSMRRNAAIVLAGVGGAALVAGTAFALVSRSDYASSNDGYCTAGTDRCTDERGVTQRGHAITYGDLATVGVFGGALCLAGGALLWLTAPSTHAHSDALKAVRVSPEIRSAHRPNHDGGELLMRARLGLLVALAPIALSCNAILGQEEGIYEPVDASIADAGGGGGDAGCGDLKTQTANCGACGHDCLGGQCTEGLCGPTIIGGSPSEFAGFGPTYGLVQIGDNLFGSNWYESAELVYRQSKTTTAAVPPPVFPAAEAAGFPMMGGAANGLATDGTTLFLSVFQAQYGWLAGIYAVDPMGTGKRIASTPTGQVWTIGADDDYVYFSDGAGLMHVVSHTGSAIAEVQMGSSSRSPILTQGGNVYFQKNGVLVGGAAPGTSTLEISAAMPHPDAFATDGMFVYWADKTTGRIFRRLATGKSAIEEITPGAPLDLVIVPSGGTTSMSLLVDAQYIYVDTTGVGVMPGAGRILRLAKTGATAAETMLTLDVGIVSITQDDHALYFATWDDAKAVPARYATLERIAK